MSMQFKFKPGVSRWNRTRLAVVVVFALILGGLGTAPWNVAAAGPTAPFTECPHVGPNTGCKLLISVQNTGLTDGDPYAARVYRDPDQGYLNGGITSGEVLVGLRNDTTTVGIASLQIRYPDDLDIHPYGGFCGQSYSPPPGNLCAQGDDYAGANVASTRLDAVGTGGGGDVFWVTFKPLMPGQVAYFAAPIANNVLIKPGWLDIGLPSYGSISKNDLDGADDGLQALFRCYEGDPVNCATGSLVEDATDVDVPGRGANLHLTRTYSSLRALNDTTIGRYGYGWDDSYARRLIVGTSTVDYVAGGGASTRFTNTANGYTAETYVLGKLTKNSDGTFLLNKRDNTTDRYSATGQLTSITDRNGYTTTLNYSSNRLQWVRDEAGRKLSFDYNADGTVSKVTRPDAETVTYTYNAGNLASVKTPGNRTTTYTYNSTHGLTRHERPDGGRFTNTLDAQGRVTAQEDPVGRTTTWAYQRPANAPSTSLAVTTTLTRPNGRTDQYRFDDWARLTTKTVGTNTPSPRLWSYGYDKNTGQRTDVMNPLGDFLQINVDDRGNQTQQIDEEGRTENWTYNTNNDLTAYTDAAGTKTQWTYDAQGNVLTQTQPLSTTSDAVTRYYYDDSTHPGDVTRLENANGSTTTATWTVNGDLATVTDAAGNTTRRTSDQVGRVLTLATPVQHAAGAKSSYEYNVAGDLTKVTHPTGGVDTFTYDPMGRVTTQADADSNTTTTAYNKVGEVTKTTKPGGQEVIQAWNNMGNMTGQNNGASSLTWAYDLFGQMTQATDPNGATSFGYDGAGNRTSLTDPLGRTTTWTYDPQGRPKSVSYSNDAGKNATYKYDDNGRLVKMTDNTGISTWSYDLASRITTQTSESAGTVKYAYDKTSNSTEVTYPDGQVAQRAYNERGLMTSVDFGTGQAAIHADFSYDSDGNLTQLAYPDGTTSTRTYDLDSRITRIKDTKSGLTLLNAPYDYTPAGRVKGFNLTPVVTAATDTTAALTMTSVERGADDRVTKVSALNGLTQVERFQYSSTGDITKRVNGSLIVDLGSRDLTYSADGQRLTKQTVSVAGLPGPSTTFGYNELGARTSSKTTVPTLTGTNTVAESRYHYDQAGRLTGFDGAPLMLVNKSVTDLLSQSLQQQVDFDMHLGYRYDGLNRLAGVAYDATVRDNPGIITDGLHNFIRGPGGIAIAQTISLNVLNLAPGGTLDTALVIDGTSVSAGLRGVLDTLPPLILHTDRQDSVRLVTTKDALPVAALSYDSYGASKLTSINKILGLDATALILPIRYTGAYTDVMSGLTYLHNRWYDPYTAQFISVDPAVTATNDPYAYTSGDPITRTDPFGLDDKDEVSGWVHWAPFVIGVAAVAGCFIQPEACPAIALGAGSLAAGLTYVATGDERQLGKDLVLTILTLGLANRFSTLEEIISGLPTAARLLVRTYLQVPAGVGLAGWIKANC